MNKAKHRFEVELKTCGFVKIEPNVWAYHPDIQIEGRTRVDIVLAGGVLAVYNPAQQVWRFSERDRYQIVKDHKDVEYATNILCPYGCAPVKKRMP